MLAKRPYMESKKTGRTTITELVGFGSKPPPQQDQQQPLSLLKRGNTTKKNNKGVKLQQAPQYQEINGKHQTVGGNRKRTSDTQITSA